MTTEELRQAAIDCVGAAIKGDKEVAPYVLEAAITVLLSTFPKP